MGGVLSGLSCDKGIAQRSSCRMVDCIGDSEGSYVSAKWCRKRSKCVKAADAKRVRYADLQGVAR